MTENTSPILGHRFQKGESGNPAGKPRGARHKTTLMAERLMQDDVEKIVSAVLPPRATAIARSDASPSRRRWAASPFAEALPAAESFRYPRSWAFTLLGLDAYCAAAAEDSAQTARVSVRVTP